MMRKLLVSLLSVGMFLGVFGVANDNMDSPNAMELTVQADTNSDNTQTISYQVYDRDSDTRSNVNPYFTNSATVTPNDEGTYKVTLTARIAHVSGVTGIDVPTIDNQTPKISDSYLKLGKRYVDISFNVDNPSDLSETIQGTVQTKLGPINVDQVPVDFKFDSSTLAAKDNNNSLADSLQSITETENNLNNTINNAKGLIDNAKSDVANAKSILTPIVTDSDTTETNNNSSNNDSDKTVLKELTYKIAKNDGDGSFISPYFTNTAKVMQNPDGTYYVEVTMKYPKKFGNKAFQINSINNVQPYNLSFTSQGDSNYIKFNFPINKLTDLSNLIPGNISINLPDYGLTKDLGFNFDFGSLNSSELSKLTNSSNVSDTLASLSNMSKSSSVKAVDDNTEKTGTLPQTGNQGNHALVLIGSLILVLWIILLKGTYLKR